MRLRSVLQDYFVSAVGSAGLGHQDCVTVSTAGTQSDWTCVFKWFQSLIACWTKRRPGWTNSCFAIGK